MAAPMEVAVCTDSAAQLWSCIVWELHSGANLLTYRGGQAGPRGLALLNGEYLLAAQLGKNYISAWELQRKDQLQQKIMCPGPVTCLTTSPNGLYVLAGIAESIYLWEVSTGNLLVILSRHYQDVSCLRFTGDSSHFLSGGKDCLVLVWSLCSVLQVDPSRTPAPRHVWSRHTLPITDLHCGFGGPLARVATSSLDQTVKVGTPSPKWICESRPGSWQALGQREPVSRLLSPGWQLQTAPNPPDASRLKDGQRVDGPGLRRLGNSQLAACAWRLPGQTSGDLRAHWPFGLGGGRGPAAAKAGGGRGRGPERRVLPPGRPGLSASPPPGATAAAPVPRGPERPELLSHPHPQLWEVSSGELLLSVLFDVAIVAVTMDLAEHHLFCGGSDGSIFQVDLCAWPGQREKTFQPEQDSGKAFRGHRNQVTCLSVSTDGSVLLSGSHDETVRLWDVQSKQCIRTVTLKGPVTNASIMLAPLSMLSSDFRPGLPLPHFNKHLLGAEHGDEPHRGGFTLRLGLHQQGSEPSHLERAEQLHAVMSGTMEKSVLGGQDQLRIRVAELEDEVRNLRKVNRDLFDFSTRIITRPAKRCTSGRKEVPAHPRSQQHGP
ncbi:WD repeat-containing protein 18 isoform X2 [Leopardus geoffroyi]|uniref:WD repeat-containing protein 18 isoform X2 n=2 Tax=Leopardus geoffroyi TaxID=46844 RepID=UPI001E26487A|nr:WD repeat-containing protein 18 isoform X2 [Leopardus geoffroyi]